VFAVKHFQMPVGDGEDDLQTSKSQKKTLFATGFFMFIVLLIGFHLMGIGEITTPGTGSSSGGGSKYDYEVPMVQSMNQHIQTGFPPF
jgi:hypothetical protein